MYRVCNACGAFDIDDNHGCAGKSTTPPDKRVEMMKEREPREWWIGRTESGWDKWLTIKHPEETECRNVFICRGADDEKCVEYIPVIEHSAYTQVLKERDELKAANELHFQSFFGAVKERDEARAEVETLNGHLEWHHALLVETKLALKEIESSRKNEINPTKVRRIARETLARLRAGKGGAGRDKIAELTREINEKRAEVERLKGLLEAVERTIRKWTIKNILK